jgi:deoxyhypusine synthase
MKWYNVNTVMVIEHLKNMRALTSMVKRLGTIGVLIVGNGLRCTYEYNRRSYTTE